MDSFYSKSNLKSDFKPLDKELGKQLDSGELNRSSKHIDSGVCVDAGLSSVSSILTSSSSLASSSSYSRRSAKQSHRPHHSLTSSSSISDSLSSPLSPLSSAALITKDSGLFESAELTDQYDEYEYDEKEEASDDERDIATSTNYDLIKEQELISKSYFLSDENLQDKDGNTMLHLAVLENKPQLAFHIISLLPHPDYLDVRNNWSQTALHLACLTAQTQIVRRLIASGATINLIDENGNTGLHLACRTGDLNLVKQFFQPITKNETVSAKLSYGVSATSFSFQKFILNEKNFEGENCIFLAAQSGNFELIQYLVMQGAEINSQELKEGNTVLHLAVRLKSVDLIEFLIQNCNALVNQVNYANKTPLAIAWHMLASNPNSKRIKIMTHLLKQHGGEPLDYSDESSDESSSAGEQSDQSD